MFTIIYDQNVAVCAEYLVVGTLALLQCVEIELARACVGGVSLQAAHQSLVVEGAGALGGLGLVCRLLALHWNIRRLLLLLPSAHD